MNIKSFVNFIESTCFVNSFVYCYTDLSALDHRGLDAVEAVVVLAAQKFGNHFVLVELLLAVTAKCQLFQIFQTRGFHHLQTRNQYC